MQWYYESSGQRQGPIDDATFGGLIRSGVIQPSTLVWTAGMADWAAASQAAPDRFVQATGAGAERCAQCGGMFAQSELISLMGRQICGACKVTALQNVKSGTFDENLSQEDRNGPIWENRQGKGLVTAFYETLKGAFLKTGPFFSEMRPIRGKYGAPLAFYMIGNLLGQISVTAVQMMFGGVMGTQFGGQGLGAGQMAFGVGSVVGLLLFIPFAAIGAFIGAAIVQIGLMITAGKKTAYETTFRALCYAQGTAGAIMVIPVLGWIVGIVFSIYASIVSLARTHEISGMRAALAVFGPGLLCGCLFFALFASLIVGNVSRTGLN